MSDLVADAEGYRPLLFRLGDPAEQQAWHAWRSAQLDHVRFRDTLADQLGALIKCRQPKTSFTRDALEQAVVRHRRGRSPEELGVWAYYPWRRIAVRLLEEDDFVELRTSRNRYKITYEEQERLRAKVVGIVGLSVGGQIAVTMAVERTCGELRLADFDRLELSNLNRLPAGVFDLGTNKAVLAARSIAEIDPFLKVVCYQEGLTPENLDRFLLTGGRIDVLVEECDGLEMKLRSRQRARELGIPVVMEANDRGTLDIERFDREPERPILHGFLAGVDLGRLGELRSNEDKVPIIMPMVGEATMSNKLRASLLEVGESLESWPQLASDVALGAALVTNTVRRVLLDELTGSGRFFVDLDALVADPLPVADAAVPASGAGEVSTGMAAAAPPLPGLDSAAEPGQLALDGATVEHLLAAATAAPSGGNEQPWSWVARGPNLALLLEDPFGDVLLNFRDVARRIALGAAVENVVLCAHALGLRVKIAPAADGSRVAARFGFFPGSARDPELEPRAPERDALAAEIQRRHTNRRVVAGATLAGASLAPLVDAVASVAGCRLHVVHDRAAITELADVVARAERIRMLHPVGHRDLVREVRWTREEARRTRDGIDLATLELTAAEHAGFRMLQHAGVARLLRSWRRGHALEKLARKAIAAAPALGLVTAPGDAPRDHLAAGRAIQRAWLTASRLALAIQPHTSALYLFARAFGGGAADFDAETLRELSELRARFETAARLHGTAVFMFRIFPACEPPATCEPVAACEPIARSLRRPVHAS